MATVSSDESAVGLATVWTSRSFTVPVDASRSATARSISVPVEKAMPVLVKHPIQDANDTQMSEKADAIVDEVIAALTDRG